MINRRFLTGMAAFVFATLLGTECANAQAVVTDGRFTNVYVWPMDTDPNWDDYVVNKLHMSTAFTRESIDRATETLINGASPSYFDALGQYGIHVPVFFGSTVAPASCVDAALKDAFHGVMQYDTIRSLANCHGDGLDPSPQLNLIFSPDLHVAAPPNVDLTATSAGDMCQTKTAAAWHHWGLNVPNFAALPLEPGCVNNFGDLMANLSHEDVEMLSDPAQFGHGAWGGGELADQCENTPARRTVFFGLTVSTYFSDKTKTCVPAATPALPSPSPAAETLLDVSGNDVLGGPFKRFTNDDRTLTLSTRASQFGQGDSPITILFFTGNDDLRGGGDDVNVIAKTKFGCSQTLNSANNGMNWGNWTIHSVSVTFPACPTAMHELASITIAITEGGHSGSPDNWNLQRVKITGVPAAFFQFPSSTPSPKPAGPTPRPPPPPN